MYIYIYIYVATHKCIYICNHTQGNLQVYEILQTIELVFIFLMFRERLTMASTWTREQEEELDTLYKTYSGEEGMKLLSK